MKKKRVFVQPKFDEFPTYKGGTTTTVDGYVFEFCPGHPLQNRWGFVAQHRLVAEDKLGRPLKRKVEHVHHKDGCRHNNHPHNLEVLDRLEHLKLHRPDRFLKSIKPIDPERLKKLLAEGGLKYAAKRLHVHTSTLRNRFPDLIAPYKRRRPTKIDDPRAIKIALKAAADPNIQLRDVVRQTGMSAMTVLRICRRNGAMWVKKTRKGEIRRTYAGKPTPRWLAANGHTPESVGQSLFHQQTPTPQLPA